MEKKEKVSLREKYNAQYNFNPESITLDTQIGKLPKVPKKPNINEVKKKEVELREQIEKLKQNKNQMYLKNKEKFVQIDKKDKQIIDQFDQIKEKFKELKKSRKLINQQLTQLNGELDQLKKQKQQCVTQYYKNRKIKYINQDSKKLQSKQEIKKRMDQLETIIMRDSLSQKEEKQINFELQTLQTIFLKQNSKERFKEIQRCNKRISQLNIQIELHKNKIKNCLQNLNNDKEEFHQLKQLKQKLEEEKKKIQQKIEDQLKKKNLQSILDLKKAKIQQIKTQIKQKKDKINKLYENHNKQFDNYMKIKVEHDWIQWATRQKKRLQQRKNQEEEKKIIKKIQQQQVKLFKQEIKAAEQIIKYLQNFIQKRTKDQQLKKAQPNKDLEIGAQFDGMTIIKKKVDLEDIQQKDRKNKKGKIKKKKEVEKLNHPLQIMNDYQTISLQLPLKYQNFQASLQSVREKLAYYKQKKNNENIIQQKE